MDLGSEILLHQPCPKLEANPTILLDIQYPGMRNCVLVLRHVRGLNRRGRVVIAG